MPITFRQCQPSELTPQDRLDVKKLCEETEFVTTTCQHIWVFADFNERIVGAMLLKSLVTTPGVNTMQCDFLAVRKATRSRGVAQDLLQRWTKQSAINIEPAAHLPKSLQRLIRQYQ